MELQRFTLSLLSSAFVVCLTLFLTWTLRREKLDHNDDRIQDQEMADIIERLRRVQDRLEIQKRKDDTEMKILVHDKFAWIHKENTVANLFIRQSNHEAVIQDSTGKNASLVFVHQLRSAGSHVISCMNNISYEKRISLSPVMTLRNRLLWDSSSIENRKYQNLLHFHRGPYSFGMCENHTRKCAYFTIFRDPFDSLVSQYKHCKSNENEEFCVQQHASNETLYEWVRNNAGMLLHQFIFSHDLCRTDLLRSESEKSENSNRNEQLEFCPYHQRRYFDRILSEDEKNHIANYIKDNIRKWFAAVGMFEEIDQSMKMFQSVFNHSFSRCKSRDFPSSSEDRRLETNSAHSEERDDSDDDDSDDEDVDFLDEVQTIKDNLNIKDILKYDYLIYNEAKRVYHIQKQVLLNKLGNT